VHGPFEARLTCLVVNAKYEAEHHLRQIKHINYTIIRPGGLSNDDATGAKLGKVGVGLTR
jgi:biliverdin reductase/flavin reductase